MKKVLSTKTLDENTISYARSLNLEVKCIDFISTQKVDFKIDFSPALFDAVVFTSANAVSYFLSNPKMKKLLQEKSIFSTPGKTAELLEQQGLKPDFYADNAFEISQLIVSKNIKSVLHICGNLRFDWLEKNLGEAGIGYHALVVYETLPNKAMLNENFDAVMFYSPSGVRSFFEVNRLSENVVCCCIGALTALWAKNESKRVIASEKPLPGTMVETLARYFEPGK